jgi:hypothetical protein
MKKRQLISRNEQRDEQNADVFAEGIEVYGDLLLHYEGRGELTLEDSTQIQVAFKAGQLTDGNILLLCQWPLEHFFAPFMDWNAAVSKFSGLANNGYQLVSTSVSHESAYLPSLPEGIDGYWVALVLRELTVVSALGEARQARYGLTNFLFFGTEYREQLNAEQAVLPLKVQNSGRGVDITISPVSGYKWLSQHLKVLKGIKVTCEAIVDIEDESGIELIDEFMDNLVLILSVATGTKVQHVYLEKRSGEGRVLSRTHRNRVTKRYGSLSLLDTGVKSGDEMKAFVEKVYDTFAARKADYRLNRGLVDSFLDARAQADYLELRGVKVAATVEMMKDLFVSAATGHQQEFVIEPKKFDKLRRKISKSVSDVLKGEVSDDQIKAVKDKLGELNRKTFKSSLEALYSYLGLRA